MNLKCGIWNLGFFMPKKKVEEEVEETVETGETNAAEAVEAAPADEVPAEKKAKRTSAKKTTEAEAPGEPSRVESVLETVASAVDTVAGAVSAGASALVSAVTGSTEEEKPIHTGTRAEKIGVVASDKMTKTVTVRVDRLVKHPVYRKYIRKRKKFMAHDELESKIGDKVRIVETRPLSARKRWRVVEIIQKAER